MAVVEMEIITSLRTIDIGPPGAPLMAKVEVYNETIPGPQIDLEVGDTLVVRLINDLEYRTGIHWHGIEMQNNADGTPVTQDGVPGAELQTLGNGVEAGGTYLYKFTVTRPGLFWYHPHHFHSTNRVFRGLYGMIVVSDPAAETALTDSGVLPDAANTHQVVLSDTTVCKAPGENDDQTYNHPTAEWLGGLTAQSGPQPVHLCEILTAGAPNNIAVNEDGMPADSSYAEGDIPNLQRNSGQTNEGQTVLTNGRDVGGRPGTPAAPGALPATNIIQTVQPGQGVRLQIVNCAITRYFRLVLTTNLGVQEDLVRVGGEGGLLNEAVVEGGVMPDGMDTKYFPGEILLPPASRADVVFAVPDDAGVTDLTLWTRDYERKGGSWSDIPTVPVMHFSLSGAAVAPPYSIAAGDDLLNAVPPIGPKLQLLDAPAAGVTLLNPNTFSPPKPGLVPGGGVDIHDIQFTTGGGSPGINGIPGNLSNPVSYRNPPNAHLGSTRYARSGDLLELRVTNISGTHHPFHLHGFSFQAISLAPRAGAPGTITGSYTWPYPEFRDTVDVPNQYTLTFRVRLEDHLHADGVTLGGALGRWLFHCHIFFHAHRGMIGELVVTNPDGSEKPYVDVGGSWTYAPSGGIATRSGTYNHPDGKAITSLTATLEDETAVGTITYGGGNWSWNSGTLADTTPHTYVYVTATDEDDVVDQTVFRLKIGGADDGSDIGDPHIHTVDGKRYDFQAVGEFVLLRDRDGMEIQARQTPVLTGNPITDPFTGLTSCVSLNTAVAARVGDHRIAFQPGEQEGQLQFYIDGRPAELSTRGINLDGNRVSGFDAGGNMALRVDYAHHAVLIVTPHFWITHGLWYLNVSVSRTHANEGVMGPIPQGSWLPRLSSGATVGPRPKSLADRYTALYKTFADSWRVSDHSSLFVYAPGTSTATFSDRDWPAIEPPCELKEQFKIPGVPVLEGMPLDEARQICQLVTDPGLNQDCVFDVATTGDEFFAQGYRVAQEIRDHGTAVQLSYAEEGILTAIVSPLASQQPAPAGAVTFYLDGAQNGRTVALNTAGRATWRVSGIGIGAHSATADYVPGAGKESPLPSSSPTLKFAVSEAANRPDKKQPKGCLAILVKLGLISK